MLVNQNSFLIDLLIIIGLLFRKDSKGRVGKYERIHYKQYLKMIQI